MFYSWYKGKEIFNLEDEVAAGDFLTRSGAVR
jgi:hypothetical protein